MSIITSIQIKHGLSFEKAIAYIESNYAPIVHCKDCFKRCTSMCGMKHERADMDYCSCGERMEGDEEHE